MTPPSEVRRLDELVRSEAPLGSRRAASVMVAVAREAARLEAAGRPVGPIGAEQVRLCADASVVLEPGATSHEGAGGASLGALLFELLTGRPPLGREDAYEPAVIASLSPTLRALMARSLSDAPGQWPTAQEWSDSLEAEVGGLAPPLAPRAAARELRRRRLVVLGMAVLLAASLAAVLLAPRWLDSLDEGASAVFGRAVETAQAPRASTSLAPS